MAANGTETLSVKYEADNCTPSNNFDFSPNIIVRAKQEEDMVPVLFACTTIVEVV